MDAHDKVISNYIADLIDSCIFDDVLYIHRAIKLEYFHLITADIEDSSYLQDAEGSGMPGYKSDSVNKLPSCCRCVKCNCKVAATRYASHLSNCMGLGRNSSRRANKRIAEQQRFEDSDDVDETYYHDSSPASGSGIKVDHGEKHSSNFSGKHSSVDLHRLAASHNSKSRSASIPYRLSSSVTTPSNNPQFTASGKSNPVIFGNDVGFPFEDEETHFSEPCSSSSSQRIAVNPVDRNFSKRHHKAH